MLTLHRTYYLVDIPLLYTLLILVSPLALALLSQGRTALVLSASWLLWAAYQLFPAQAGVPWTIEGNHLFFFSAWQVFFFTGLALGWHHATLTERLAGFPRRAALAGSAVGFATLVALYAVADRLPELWSSEEPSATDLQLFLLESLFAKADVRVGRIVASAIAFGFLYLLITEAWRPISRGLGWFLRPLGQCALYAYAAHVALAIPAKLLAEAGGTALGAPEPVNAAIQVAVLAAIWTLIRGRLLFVDPARGSARYAWPLGAAAACLLVLSLLPLPTAPQVVMAAEPDTRAARVARAFGTPVPSHPLPAATVSLTPTPEQPVAITPTREALDPSPTMSAVPAALNDYMGPLHGTFQQGEIASAALSRSMPYFVYLPPDYETSQQRYPVLYMLHGNSGSNEEWAAYGLIGQADDMIARGEIRPLIIVLPQGDYSYWVNQADGGAAYGDYLSNDLLRHINRTFRVLSGAEHRAIGGLSMGADGALIHAFTESNRFGAVGAHSPALPAEGARLFLGTGDEFARRDPIQLAHSEPWLDELAIWIDAGDQDPWLDRVEELHTALADQHISHEFHVFPGEHWGPYWSEHVADYLHFYDAALHRDGAI